MNPVAKQKKKKSKQDQRWKHVSPWINKQAGSKQYKSHDPERILVIGVQLIQRNMKS
jgi:hypothetical protein